LIEYHKPPCDIVHHVFVQVTHAPGNLEAPVQAAATAMGVVQAAFAAFTEMSRLQADWEKTQQDYQAAMDAHAELESTLPLDPR
jgi:hypothetical protein